MQMLVDVFPCTGGMWSMRTSRNMLRGLERWRPFISSAGGNGAARGASGGSNFSASGSELVRGSSTGRIWVRVNALGGVLASESQE